MRTPSLIAALLTGLLSAPLGHAAVTVQCASVDSLDEGSEECSDNKKYGQAGIDCLEAFEKAIHTRSKLAAQQLAASNQAHVDKAGNAQNHNFTGSSADYDLSQQALAELIAAGQAARANVDGYLNHIYYPEDFDAPEEVIGDPMQFLDNVGCYSENERGLKDILKRMDKDIADLEATKAASGQRGATASSRASSTGSLNAAPAAGTHALSAPKAVPKGQSANGASDITGVKQDQDKRAK